MEELKENIDKQNKASKTIQFELDKKDQQILELQRERDERQKVQMQEIENLKLSHQQELYMMKRMNKQ